MIPWEESIERLDAVMMARSPLPAEAIEVADAFDRILAEEVRSRLDLPPFDKAAMDGYAIIDGDQRDEYEVIEHIPAGQFPTKPLAPGQAARIMTGAPLPENAGRVVKWEDTDNGTATVHVERHGGKSNVCKLGEDVRRGDAIFSPGARVTPVVLANLLSCGVERIQARRVPRVAILATGDEIVSSPKDLQPGKIMDANGPMLESLCRRHGLELIARCIVPDTIDDLRSAVEELSRDVDLLLLTGGVSAGDYDFVPPVLRDCGFTIHFDSVAVQPGKPLTFATSENTVIVGLPGNPVSVLNGFHVTVMRVVSHMLGRAFAPRSFAARLRNAYRRRRGRRAAFVPCRLYEDGTVEAIAYHGSAHLLAVPSADGMMFIPREVTELAAGAPVAFYPRFEDSA